MLKLSLSSRDPHSNTLDCSPSGRAQERRQAWARVRGRGGRDGGARAGQGRAKRLAGARKTYHNFCVFERVGALGGGVEGSAGDEFAEAVIWMSCGGESFCVQDVLSDGV